MRVSVPLFLHPNIAPNECFGNDGVRLSEARATPCFWPAHLNRTGAFPRHTRLTGSLGDDALLASPSIGHQHRDKHHQDLWGSTVALVGYHCLTLSDCVNPVSLWQEFTSLLLRNTLRTSPSLHCLTEREDRVNKSKLSY